MEHRMKLGDEPFIAIKEGRKTIEIRLYDEKRRMISLGDEIVFTENDNPSEAPIRTRVIKLFQYPTFEELFANHDSAMFGGERDRKQLLERIKQFYSDADELKYGVVGIHIERID